MITFLIQTVNNEITHDFAFVLKEAVKYQNWYRMENYYNCIYSDTIYNFPNCIPIGSVEFVHEYLRQYYNIDELKPLNIPKELHREKYLGRNIIYGTKDLITKKSFVKSTDKIKFFTDIVDSNQLSFVPDGNYMISDIIEIQSEYRCFVYENKLVGIQNYSGDFTIFPNIEIINDMISDYVNSPIAYTLDIGILNNGKNVIIECHNFYSCGLYSTNFDYRILPQMFIKSFNEIIKLK
jgi:hypothetical protein